LKLKTYNYHGESINTGINVEFKPSEFCVIEFKIENYNFQQKVLVLKESPFQIILGLDFVNQHNVLMDVPNGKYSIRSRNSQELEFLNFTNSEFLCALQGLNNTQSEELNILLQDFPKVMSGKIGCTDLVKCKLEVEGPPIALRPYPVSIKKKAIIKKQVEEMLKLGIIVPSDSEWAFPVTLHTRDKGESYRFTLDFRRLNARMKSDPFPYNRMDTLLHKLGDAKFLSVIDLKKGYWQIQMEPSSMKYCTFCCDEGKFSFQRMPFGIKTGSSIFQRFVNKVLGKSRGSFADAYLDDIIVFSSSWSEHLEHLRYVLQQLESAGLTVNPSKCQFGKTTIKYLGFVVSPEGVQIDREKISAILDFPKPRNIKEIRRFLGMCGFYRHFIDNYSKIVEPLTKLLKKSNNFNWKSEQQASFEELIKLIADSVTLAFPVFSERFIVSTDASDVGLAAVLSQNIHGHERPIAFASRTLSPAERSYDTCEKECCGILFALKKFEQYLDGVEFTLKTDNAALVWLNSMKNVNSKFMRWALRIQDFQATIVHCPGRDNVIADAMSRATVGVSEDEDEEKEKMYPPLDYSKPSLLCTLTSDITLDSLKNEQDKDSETQALLTDLSNEFIVENGILYKLGKYGGRIPFIPKPLRSAVLEYFHDRPEAGHLGFRKTMLRLIRRVFWFGMQEDIFKYILSCPKCQYTKNPTTKPSGQMKSAKSKGPWDILACDLVGPLVSSRRGNTQLLVVVDHFSKWVELFPLRKATAHAVANILEKQIFCRWGAPACLLSDNGTQFTSKLLKSVCKTWGVRNKYTTFYHPQANITERINKNIVAIMRTYVESKHSKWDEYLPEVGLALRTAVSDSTGYSPSMLNLGREITTPFDRRLENEDEDELESRIEYKNALINRLESVYARARLNMEKAQQQQAKYYDMRHKKVNFEKGDLVCLRTHYKSEKDKKVMKKLSYRWIGPYMIDEVVTPLTYALVEYESKKPAGIQSIKNLKRFYDRPAAVDTANSKVDTDSTNNSSPNAKGTLSQNAPVISNYNLRSRKKP
jgi:hypothetical protein